MLARSFPLAFHNDKKADHLSSNKHTHIHVSRCSWYGSKLPPTLQWRWWTSGPAVTLSTSTTRTSWWWWTTPSCLPISRCVSMFLCVFEIAVVRVYFPTLTKPFFFFLCTNSAPWLWELTFACTRPQNTWTVMQSDTSLWLANSIYKSECLKAWR